MVVEDNMALKVTVVEGRGSSPAKVALEPRSEGRDHINEKVERKQQVQRSRGCRDLEKSRCGGRHLGRASEETVPELR